MFPKDEVGFRIDDQYYIGSSGLLVKPVTAKNILETTVYLAEDQVRPLVSFDLGLHLIHST
jgi:mannosyl-oligosaccharide alpha-1,3-glucosidase